jgi:DNA-binding NarL/FixJ family response regulator
MEAEGPIRILVADDHPVVRGGLVALLRTIEGLEVVGEASDGATAVREAQLTRPDVVLMDVRMPDLDGVEATRRIRAAVPATRVLMLTMYDDDATVFTAMQAGAQGYLLKEAEQDEIVRAVRAVVAGEAIFGPGVGARVGGPISGPPPGPTPADPSPHRTPTRTG